MSILSKSLKSILDDADTSDTDPEAQGEPDAVNPDEPTGTETEASESGEDATPEQTNTDPAGDPASEEASTETPEAGSEDDADPEPSPEPTPEAERSVSEILASMDVRIKALTDVVTALATARPDATAPDAAAEDIATRSAELDRVTADLASKAAEFEDLKKAAEEARARYDEIASKKLPSPLETKESVPVTVPFMDQGAGSEFVGKSMAEFLKN